MYCNIKKRECADAGQITYNGCSMFGEREGLHTATVCYKKGGYITCNY